MRKVKAEPITYESYAPYGTFYHMCEPEGASPLFSGPDDGILSFKSGFFPDPGQKAGSDEDYPGRVSYNDTGDDPAAE